MSARNTFAVAALVAATALAAIDRVAVAPVAAQDRVTTLLAQVRTALGGEAALAAVKAISAEGSYKRVTGTRSRDSVVSLLIVRPDKLRRSEESRFFTTTERTTTFDGTQVWDDTVQAGAGVGGGHGGGFDHGGGGHMPDSGGGDHGGWDHDGDADTDAPAGATEPGGALTAEQIAAARVRRLKMELQRWTLTFFADTGRPFTSAGRAESPDGSADLLETTDEAGRPVRYVVDATSHLPLMVQYQQARLAAPAPSGPRGVPSKAPTLATMAMHLSAYQKVDGVMVPHQIDISIDGRASEAWTLDAVKINPKIKPGMFKKPAK